MRAMSVSVGTGRPPEAVRIQQQPGMGLHFIQRCRIGGQLGFECVAPCQQQIRQRALAQRVGACLQLGAAFDLPLCALQLYPGVAGLLQFTGGAPGFGFYAHPLLRQLLFGHFGLCQCCLCIGPAPGAAQGDRHVNAQHALLPAALAAGPHAYGGVAMPFQRGALCLLAGLLRFGLCQFQLVVVVQNFGGPLGGREICGCRGGRPGWAAGGGHVHGF